MSLLLFFLTFLSSAHAFKIGSSFSDPCHEWITLYGFFQDGEQAIVPRDAFATYEADESLVWLQIAEYLEKELNHTFDSDIDRFLAISLIIGVRYPDQEGYALSDLSNLRDVHMASEGQEEHALRALEHDHELGDQESIAQMRQFILSQVDLADDAFQRSRSAGGRITKQDIRAQSTAVDFWLEHYGIIKVQVWEPMFIMGKAVHALQDSFAHTYRSDDTVQIYAVGNFVEAFDADYDESKDGPRHSNHIDSCNNSDVFPLRDSAVLATRALFLAAKSYFAVLPSQEEEKGLARQRVEAVLDSWLSYQSGCGFSQDYCESKWVSIAKKDETQSLFGCTTLQSSTGSMLVLFLCGVVCSRREYC